MKNWVLIPSAMLLAASTFPGYAQELAPDEVAVFDGSSRLDYPGSPALELSAPASVEFWVSPGWRDVPAYDPCIVSSIGEAGVNFAVHITADRKSIGLYAGERFATLPFDFTDALMHHVALISFGPELTEVQIDGETAGLLKLGFAESPSVSFHIGSLDGEQAPFVSAVARVRLWNTVLGPDANPDDLAAQSTFSREGLALAVYPLDAETILAGLSTAEEAQPDPDETPEPVALPVRRTLKPLRESGDAEPVAPSGADQP